MRFSSVASLCTVAVATLFLAPNNGGATSTLSAFEFGKSAGTAALLQPVSCKLVNGHLKCSKHSKKDDDNDDGDHHKDKNDKGTKTVKLIKEQNTCVVITPGKGGMGCSSPRVSRCDKLKDGDEVCCCYHIDDTPPAQ